jgi:uncharacterized protein YcbK (DUF882 family)
MMQLKEGSRSARCCLARRSLLGFGIMATGFLATRPAFAVHVPHIRKLDLLNPHTGDRFSDVYWERGRYVPDAVQELNWVMRDHHANVMTRMDPRLLDMMFVLGTRLHAVQPIQILSGYRTAKTNLWLRRDGYATAEHSMHLVARAVDIHIEGVSLSDLRRAAVLLHVGGVGYYPENGFVHIDTGPIRYW